jgi:ankyrin repeat protein
MQRGLPHVLSSQQSQLCTLQEGNTALHLAAAGGHTRCVQLLMGSRNTDQRSRQQQLQLRNAAGYTPLVAAAAAGHAAVVDAMLLAGADMHSSVLQVRSVHLIIETVFSGCQRI